MPRQDWGSSATEADLVPMTRGRRGGRHSPVVQDWQECVSRAAVVTVYSLREDERFVIVCALFFLCGKNRNLYERLGQVGEGKKKREKRQEMGSSCVCGVV